MHLVLLQLLYSCLYLLNDTVAQKLSVQLSPWFGFIQPAEFIIRISLLT